MAPAIVVCLAIGLFGPASSLGQSTMSELGVRVGGLVERLDADRAADRRAAEAELYDLATAEGADAAAVLALLPETTDRMPPSVRSGVRRVRRRVELTLAQRAVEATRVTLTADKTPLADVLRQIGEQTGNTMADSRARFGEAARNTPITLAFEDEPFWPAVDAVLDAAGLGVYAYGGGGELTLVNRTDGARDRVGAAAYAGPFRFEPLRVTAVRGVRDPSATRLRVDVEATWEPRLAPIALSQPLSSLRADTDQSRLESLQDEGAIDAEVAPGAQAVELGFVFDLPDRSASRIATLRGELDALVPGRAADFRFEAVGAQTRPVELQQGDAAVSLERFVESGAIYELHMRVRLEGAGDALASHRGWVFQNVSYLTDADDNRIEHAGFETTLQTDSEVGIVYLFDLSDGDTDPRRLTWVYRTPVSVVTLPVKYELKDIRLP